MSQDATDNEAEALWNEVAAESAGATPATPAPTPAPQPAAVEPAAPAVAPVPPDAAAMIAGLEEKFNERLRNAEGRIGQLNGELKAQLEAGRNAARQLDDAPTQAEIRNFDAQIKEAVKGETDLVRKEIIHTALDAVSPGWAETVKSPEWAAWVEVQTDDVKKLLHSSSVGDSARMLKLYDARQPDPATQIIEQRKATLAAATATPKGVRAASTQKAWADMSDTERWEHEKRTRAKRG